MIDAFSFSTGLAVGIIFSVAVAGISLTISGPEPTVTHTTSAELAACVVAMDRSHAALAEIESWVHELQGVWIISTEGDDR